MSKIISMIILVGIIVGYNIMNVEAFKIPDEAIRLRVIANSNTIDDQYEKTLVKESIEKKLAILLENIDDINVANQIIKDNLDLFNQEVYAILKDNDFKIDYGLNYFPEKEYKGITYDEGQYQSLVVTIGSGQGNNWWCVLFPPLCLLEAEESTEVEYQFFVMELINKIFK